MDLHDYLSQFAFVDAAVLIFVDLQETLLELLLVELLAWPHVVVNASGKSLKLPFVQDPVVIVIHGFE